LVATNRPKRSFFRFIPYNVPCSSIFLCPLCSKFSLQRRMFGILSHSKRIFSRLWRPLLSDIWPMLLFSLLYFVVGLKSAKAVSGPILENSPSAGKLFEWTVRKHRCYCAQKYEFFSGPRLRSKRFRKKMGPKIGCRPCFSLALTSRSMRNVTHRADKTSGENSLTKKELPIKTQEERERGRAQRWRDLNPHRLALQTHTQETDGERERENENTGTPQTHTPSEGESAREGREGKSKG